MGSVTHIIRRRRHRRQQLAELRAQRRFWALFFGLLLTLVIVIPLSFLLGGVLISYAQAMTTLPTPQETVYRDPIIGATQIYDATGQTLLFAVQDPLGEERRWIKLDDLPEYVAEATVLWEDPDFYQTVGFNLITTFEQLWSNQVDGLAPGNTSLTGRLVRNVITQQEATTVEGRALEIGLIAEINRVYSPAEIIEWHLNTNYYGNEAYGIEAAAQVYLGKPAAELTLDEAALLVTIPTAPALNPLDNETAARGRQNDILRHMLADDLITEAQFEQAVNVNTAILADGGQAPLIAPNFALYARRQAERILDTLGWDGAQLVARGGLRITTTLDMDLYYQSECALQAHVGRLTNSAPGDIQTQEGATCFSADYLPISLGDAGTAPPDTGVIVIIDTETGVLRSMLGAGTQVTYQPGATLHPFIYLDGFLNPDPNYTAATMLLDIPRPFPGAADGLIYVPNNADGQFRGPLSLRDAMSASLLPPVTQVAHVLNLNNVLRSTVTQMGIRTLRDGNHDLSLLERGGQVSVLDMAQAYSIFAANGNANGLPFDGKHQAVAVQRIATPDGTILWEYDTDQINLSRVNILQGEVAYLVNDILSDERARRTAYGPNTPLNIDRTAAVVNGITANRIDNWTLGYTPELLVGVWMGRAGREPVSLEGFALGGAASLWRAMMDYLIVRDQLPPSTWERPTTIVETQVCRISGLGPNGACETRPEIFLGQEQFPQPDTYWQAVEVNSQTGQLATASTADALRVEQRYFIPPPEAIEWWRANNRPLPPTEFDTISRSNIFSAAVILQPSNRAYVGGEIDVRGSILDPEDMSFFQLAYGAGLNPNEWIDITGQQTEFTPGTSLGTWDVSGLDGTHVLRLSVVREDGTVETGTNIVIVDNIAPSIVLFAGEAATETGTAQVFRWPDDDIISVVADVSDNTGVDRVEFYHNGEFVAIDEEAPFGFEHEISRAGIETFTAFVFDAVGNASSTEINVEVLRSGG